MIVSGISLVLEGGGMRGMFSAGVFEAFMQKELIFPHIVGVSAGACNIVSYMSQQPLRTRRVIQNFVGDKRYCSLSNWLRTRSLFGFDFILKELPQNLLPFDYEAFRKYPGQLYVGTTDVITGKPVWYTQGDMDKDFLPLRASASLPFFAPVVTIGGHKLLDGAIVEPIPISKLLLTVIRNSLSYLPVMPVTVKNTRYRNICCASSINTILNYGKPWPDVLTYIMTSLLLPNNGTGRQGRYHPPTVPLKIGSWTRNRSSF